MDGSEEGNDGEETKRVGVLRCWREGVTEREGVGEQTHLGPL